MKTLLKVAGLIVVLAVCLHLPAKGQHVFVNMDEIQGLDPNGCLVWGASVTIPVRFTNAGEARTAISNGFRFTTSYGDLSWDNIVAEWNPAYPWSWELAWAIGCVPPVCYPYFDQGLFTNYFDNGVGFAGLTGASGTGLPADFDGIAYYITLENITGDFGALTMDSTWWEPANYWLWSGVAENVEWGGPYTLETCCCPPPPPCLGGPYTECWPQPTVLKALENNRILEFYVFCEDNEDVILSSIRVGNIPPYTEAAINGDTLYTDAFIMRFLGASGFRPIPPEGIQSSYTVSYDKVDGSSVSLTGDYVLAVYQGDVNFDTEVNIEDIVFLSDYLFQDSGQKAELFGYAMDECMDVDASGRFDLLDIQELIEIVGI